LNNQIFEILILNNRIFLKIQYFHSQNIALGKLEIETFWTIIELVDESCQCTMLIILKIPNAGIPADNG